MKTFTKILALWCATITILGMVLADVAKTCSDDSQCDPGQCCQKLKKNMMSSKRETDGQDRLPGTCQKYIAKGQICNVFSKTNGYCSCETGTECTAVKNPERVRRKTMANTVYKCLESK